MTYSTNDEVTMVTSDSERPPSKNYRGIIISILFNTSPIHYGSKQSWQCIITSSTNEEVTIQTSDSERGPSITYIEIIRSCFLNSPLYILGENKVGNVL